MAVGVKFPTMMLYAVIRMDPVAMVEHLNDPIATQAAAAMQPKKYLVYIEDPMELPWPDSPWCRFDLQLIASTPRVEERDRGLTTDMVLPIFPNMEYAKGRDPCRPKQPFPFPNCFHWFRAEISVRVRAAAEPGYDDSEGIHLSAEEHIMIEEKMHLDFERYVDFFKEKEAREEALLQEKSSPDGQQPLAHRETTVPDQAEAMDPTVSADDGASIKSISDVDTLPEGLASPSVSQAELPIPSSMHSERAHHSDAGSLADVVVRMNVFGQRHDGSERFIPLVDLWVNLEEHLTAETIPSPVDWYKEVKVIEIIINEALERLAAAGKPEPPVRPPRSDSDSDDLHGSICVGSRSRSPSSAQEPPIDQVKAASLESVDGTISPIIPASLFCMPPLPLRDTRRKIKRFLKRVTQPLSPPFLPYWP